MGRTAWILMLLVVAGVLILLALAWVDRGAEPLRWIEQPVSTPRRGG